MVAWERRAAEILRPHLHEGEELEVVARASRFESMREGEGRVPAAIGGAIGFAVGLVPLLVAGASWIPMAIVAFPFGLMGAVSGYEFANRKSVLGLTDRRLLVVPRNARPEEIVEVDLDSAALVGVEVRDPVTVLTLPNAQRVVLRAATPEDARSASVLVAALRA
jgi:hypothetical protein